MVEKNSYDWNCGFDHVALLFSSSVSIAGWCNVHLDLLAVLTAQGPKLCDLGDIVDLALLVTNVLDRVATDDWDWDDDSRMMHVVGFDEIESDCEEGNYSVCMGESGSVDFCHISAQLLVAEFLKHTRGDLDIGLDHSSLPSHDGKLPNVAIHDRSCWVFRMAENAHTTVWYLHVVSKVCYLQNDESCNFPSLRDFHPSNPCPLFDRVSSNFLLGFPLVLRVAFRTSP